MGSFCGERGLFRKQAALLERCACFVNRRRFWEEFFFVNRQRFWKETCKKPVAVFCEAKKAERFFFLRRFFLI